MKLKTLAFGAAMLSLGVIGASASAAPGSVTGATSCNAPPRVNCPEANCLPALTGAEGNATEPKTKRKFFLDYPCDLKLGEDVIFVLNLHGAGSIGNWQRHYFPVVDFKDKYRIVVATPTAATAEPQRRWVAEADDAYLQNVTEAVFKEFGKDNIKSFWLAGHSQGGITSRRIICSDYFKGKVDGFLSLGGGRIGQTATTFGRAPAAGTAPAAAPAAEQMPGCDFNFIYTAGQMEITGLPSASPWAAKYGCADRVKKADLVDARAGYVTATDQSRGPSWGRFARPGKAEEWIYPNCKGGKLVADIVRQDKGHTEGLEPVVMEEIIKLIAAAPGGKVKRS